VPIPPDPLPAPVIKVPDAISVPDDRKSYTAKFAGFVVPETVQAEVIVRVVPEMNPEQLATLEFVDGAS